MNPEALQRRVQAAQGRIPCDVVLRNVRYLDMFSCEWREGDIAIIDGVVVGLERGLKARRFFDGQGKSVVPGFIDAHVHVESSLLVPFHFQRAVLPKGTTTAVCDPHELANVMGPQGIQYFLDSSEKMDLDLRVMLSSCVPATHLETNGGGTISAEKLLPMAAHPKALGLAEMMNMPGVLNGDPEVLKKLVSFAEKRIDGHAPLLRGAKLSAYAATGISSCHESSELEEAREKLIKGMAVWIREGSVAKDLEALHPLLTLATSTSIGFCTDDRNPLDILTEGHIDHLVRETIRRGLAPEIAYRAASWSVARHYGLDQGSRRLGAIAPGYTADLVILEDAEACGIHSVLKAGQWIQELPSSSAIALPKREYGNSMKTQVPEARDLEGPAGRVHVIGVRPGKIITDRSVADSRAPGVARLSVLERYGRGSKPANGYVRGFGTGFKGAIASSVGHDSHNLIAVGEKIDDMRVAMKALIESGGGFCVVHGGNVAAKLELPFGGLMSGRDPVSLKQTLVALKSASREVGCELPEPFLQLAFLSLPVIPSLKLTDKGLVDVDKFQVIDVRAS